MHANDWRELLSRVPAHLRRLRGAADPSDLLRLERRIGQELPAAYRSFLEQGDGGWLGDGRIYGTRELTMLLGPVPCRHDRFAPSAWRRPLRRLLPFHPVDRFSVECLDLDRAESPVVWCTARDRAVLPAGAAGFLDDLHPLAREMIRWAGRPAPEMCDTYTDFLDWVLDQALELHQGVASFA